MVAKGEDHVFLSGLSLFSGAFAFFVFRGGTTSPIPKDDGFTTTRESSSQTDQKSSSLGVWQNGMYVVPNHGAKTTSLVNLVI